jgi:dTDP-4-dehydrorhamnose reductase
VRVNALFPHLLAERCAERDIRMVHISTDCVFSGHRGRYTEDDFPDPADFYGRSKLLGEVAQGGALTLRTSIIGHELGTGRSLVDWFLSQRDHVRGFRRAIYSGLTTTEFARMLETVVLPSAQLHGLMHVASDPISKFDLLRLVADIYGWHGTIEPYDDFACDRSLRADRFRAATGYHPPSWPSMIAAMKDAASAWRLVP